jgi:hypothetical protein
MRDNVRMTADDQTASEQLLDIPGRLGSGEHLVAGVDALKLGYRCTEHVATPGATHVVLSKGA